MSQAHTKRRARDVVVAFVGATALVACASNGAQRGSAVIVTTPSSATPTDAPTTTPPPTATQPPVTTAPLASIIPPATEAPATTPSTTPTPTTIALNSIAIDTKTSRDFEQPVGLATRPGDDALYVIEQGGTVTRVDPATDERTTALDLGDRTAATGERGLLGVAFHPTEPLAYVSFTDTDDNSIIAEYQVDADGNFDDESERTILTLDQPHGNHNGGDLQFGPDGMLYIAFGDGGSANDPDRLAADPTNWFGTILRIDPTANATAAYTIPADNPFGTEVWAYGLRNPWKINFDPATGDLWIADVGQAEFEEINRVSPTADRTPAGRGAHFGWSAYEATTRFNDDVDDSGGTIDPVLFYEHGDDGCSISGGAMWAQWYVYSDYCSGIVWALDLASGRNIELIDGFDDVSAVRNGPDGAVYVIEKTGSVHKLITK